MSANRKTQLAINMILSAFAIVQQPVAQLSYEHNILLFDTLKVT